MQCATEGMTNREIMDCSFHTLENHLREIFKRLEVSSRTAAAACVNRALLPELQALSAKSKPIPMNTSSDPRTAFCPEHYFGANCSFRLSPATPPPIKAMQELFQHL